MSTPDPLHQWFSERPPWIQEAARRILTNGELTEDDLLDCLNLCKNEAGIDLSPVQIPPTQELHASALAPTAASSHTLHIERIRDVAGVNAISTDKPLEFNSPSLSIIYGDNGAGKSGYIRLLKQACGARMVSDIVPNVFADNKKPASATIDFVANGKQVSASFSAAQGKVENLSGVEVFDAHCASVYVNDQNEVAFEPPILSLFTDLVGVADRISRDVEAEIKALPSSNPALPAEYAETPQGKWYSQISHKTSNTDLKKVHTWTKEKQSELESLGKQLAVKDPEKEAKTLRAEAVKLTKFNSRLSAIVAAVSVEAANTHKDLVADAKTKTEAAELAAKNAFSAAPLDGVGSAVWNELWSSARKYSAEAAYKDSEFPNVSDDARCILCQQELSEEAKTRLTSFEDYVKGDLKAAADKALRKAKALTTALTELKTAALIVQDGTAAGIRDEDEQKLLGTWAKAVALRIQALADKPEQEPLPALPNKDDIAFIKTRIDALEESAKKFDAQVDKEKRAELQTKELRLRAIKWLYEQRAAISAEVTRSEKIRLLKKAKSLANTRGLSTKKDELAETAISEAFIKRFNSEIKALAAHRVPAKLEKTRTNKGRVWHQIKIDGASPDVAAADVLSDGEYRAVSVAAFFADADSRTTTAPLVFDDPVSSLDQGYEVAIARRIVEKSKTQQVIVFTHRLSLLSLLESLAKDEGVASAINAIGPAGKKRGVPRDAPMFTQKTKAVLNTLCNQRMDAARKRLKEEGWDGYEIEANAICRDARATLERMVELDLVAEVVRRFHPEIQTKNKLTKLAKIEIGDCEFIDEMMSYFSKFIHSQSVETPAPPPPEDELQEALNQIKKWRDTYDARPIPTASNP
jgi:energy-coupling factor transporter ATP-binding protein EcfA2